MNKEESLTFLQSCIDKVKMATEQDIQFFKEIYNMNCVAPTEASDFEFVLPTSDFECRYEINDVFELETSNQDIKKSVKKQMEYGFLGVDSINQQNNENLPYAA